MRARVNANLIQLNRIMSHSTRRQVVALLSLFVVLGVFWCLKLTGITMAGEAFCGMEEHQHGENCSTVYLVCDLDEYAGHVHDESCIARELICGQDEYLPQDSGEESLQMELICTEPEQAEHFHSETCCELVLVCDIEEQEGHTHTGNCFTSELICNSEDEEHNHDSDCYENIEICGMEETDGHFHDDNCYVPGDEFICGLEETEGHSHTDDCYILLEATDMQETVENVVMEGHTHTEDCYYIGIGFGCGMTEAEGHVHTEECVTGETELGCGETASAVHTHTDACYEVADACVLEEHIHEASCYSNIDADLETEDDWEYSLRDVTEETSTARMLVSVARSQLGYTESTLNFEVDFHGIRRGITRYGQWYGNPYGDWSAMFVSFCLHYAGAADLPANAGPESMRLEWDEAGLYEPADTGVPQPGSLIFLRLDGYADAEQADVASEYINDTATTAVAIITDVNEDSITIIQGDWNDTVSERMVAIYDPAILGYGLVPECSPFALKTMATGDLTYLANSLYYTGNVNETFTSGKSFVLYVESDGAYYALGSQPASGIEQSVKAIPIMIENDGSIYTDIGNPDSLLWNFTQSDNNYIIQNVATGRYLHPGGDPGVIYSRDWSDAVQNSGTGGIKIVHPDNNHNYGICYNINLQQFEVRSKNNASTLYLGVTERYTVWLDGTDGGLGHLTGSPNTAYNVQLGSTMELPTEWVSPDKYSYKLRGWYDVTNAKYYLPGAEMEITGNAVLYADWVASTYDIGAFNAKVADTVSTNSFITTHVFDYNYLINLHSVNAEATITATNHSETWSMVTSGTVNHGNQETLDFVFIDNETGGLLCMPNNRSNHNIYPGEGVVTPNIYSAALGEILFSTSNCFDPETGEGILGKTYLGTGDHLFQIMDDPANEHYGYYYYDSKHNAASYNQSNDRFYVYEYLEGTSDAIGSTNSDFLPLNSPYANLNGKTVGTYNYDGVDGEYAGVPHYRYDSKYNSGNYNSVNNVQTDYAYGMRTDIKFYLPNNPGSGGNKDLYGNDMQFQFSGDDDLWVLIDGQLVLDIGGIHGAEEGMIDFSTGQVTVQGNLQTSLMNLDITSGDHTLSILYLERGSSLSNCSIYFNLAPRYGLQIQKEDVLTQELLDGTQFTVYEDLACTNPAELWESEEAYNQGIVSRSTFTVTNGIAELWGLGSGNTYYIKETAAPGAEGYGLTQGVIRLTIERAGLATYDVDVVADSAGNEPSKGYTVHGIEIDEETRTVYIVVTNAPETVTETTTVQVLKKWEDTISHSSDYITAYLTVTDPDGSVRRIREIVLSDENNWHYTWTNLPKYDYETMTEVEYGIEEAYESGYYSTVRKITEIELTTTEWAEATSFQNGESYILKNSNGYLSTTSASDTKLKWVDEATARNSSLALWKATISGGKYKFTNGAGHILTFYYGSGSSSRYFFATTNSENYQSFSIRDAGSGLRFYLNRYNSNYYMGTLNTSNGRISTTTNQNSGMILTPMKKISTTDIQDVEDWAYQITNTPLAANNETSVTVNKVWDIPEGYDSNLYQEYAVTVRLLANGVNTGRTVTLNLKNNWQGSFLGLPYADESGNVISYSVEEAWEQEKWIARYGEVTASDGNPPVYSVTITNNYHPGGPELPATGSLARLMYKLCGLLIMAGSLIWYYGQRRRYERRGR